MFVEDLIIKLSNMIENKINQSLLIGFQDYLLKAGIFTLASQILAIILTVYIAFIILVSLVSLLLSFNVAIALVLAIIIPTLLFILVLFLKIEKRANEIEKIPDFLRQLSSMLKVGLSLENALVDMSENGKGPLYDELRRVVVEIRMGKSLDESFNNMAMRLNSKDIEKGT